MLKIEVTEKNGKQEVNATAVGSLGTIVDEFCSAADSLKKKLGEVDERAEFIFVSTMIGTLLGLEKDDIMGTIKNIITSEDKEGEKDAPVDKQD